jgi:MoxR-like ATPase
VTTEQLIILGFLALAFLAGWIARALVGRVVNRLSPKGPVPAPASERSEIAPPAARDFKAAVRLSRDELAHAVRAYHAAVVRTFRNGADGQSGQSSLEALSVALVSLARAVDHEARALGPEQELTARLQSTGSELRRLADDVMQHSQRELPAGVFDQLEQHLISAASMILEPSRP